MPARTTQAQQIADLAAQVAALTALLTTQAEAKASKPSPAAQTRAQTRTTGRVRIPRDPNAPTRADRSRGYFLAGDVFLEAVRNKADTRTYLVGFERKLRQNGTAYLSEVYHRDVETRTPTYDYEVIARTAKDPKVKTVKALTQAQGEARKAALLAG